MSDPVTAPNAHRFEPLPPERAAVWENFAAWPDQVFFPTLVGLQKEEILTDYCRMRLPYRPELNQPAGVVHGGALATLVDTVVVPAIGAVYENRPMLLTLSMTLSYLSAIRGEDAVAEGWVQRRGRSTVFCQAEVRSASGDLAVTGSLVYAVRVPSS
ncbi:MAG: PaaI family thioesterase [Acidimicrobiales bacterium]